MNAIELTILCAGIILAGIAGEAAIHFIATASCAGC